MTPPASSLPLRAPSRKTRSPATDLRGAPSLLALRSLGRRNPFGPFYQVLRALISCVAFFSMPTGNYWQSVANHAA